MRINTLAAIAILLVGTAACDNPKPADPAMPAPETGIVPESAAPTNAVMEVPVPANTVEAPAGANNAVVSGNVPPPTAPPPPKDEPRGGIDRN